MKYDKLIRDKITDIMTKNGQEFKVHSIADSIENNGERLSYLEKKIDEELIELRTAVKYDEGNPVEELADLYEVLDAYREELGIEKTTLKNVQTKKAKEKGKFNNFIILDEA